MFEFQITGRFAEVRDNGKLIGLVNRDFRSIAVLSKFGGADLIQEIAADYDDWIEFNDPDDGRNA